MNSLKKQSKKQNSSQHLWKKIGKVKESAGQAFELEEEMKTSIQQQLSKVEHQMAKSRTLITKDYINSAALAESGFIERSPNISSDSNRQQNTRHQEFPAINSNFSETMPNLNNVLKLFMDIQQLKYKYQKFCINLVKRLQEMFQFFYELISTELRSPKLSQIFTRPLDLQNKRLKIQCAQLAEILEDRTGKICDLERQLKKAKNTISEYRQQIFYESSKRSKLAQSDNYEHFLGKDDEVRYSIQSQRPYRLTLTNFQKDSNFEPNSKYSQTNSKTNKEIKYQIPLRRRRASSRQVHNKDKIKRSEHRNEDIQDIKQKLESLKSEISRIS